MDERERDGRQADEEAQRTGRAGRSMTAGVDRERASMGTGEAGGGVGGGGATSSDVEWQQGSERGSEEGEEGSSDDYPAGGSMTNEQEFTDR